MSKNPFYTDNEGHCFYVSLANAFVVLNEGELVKTVTNEFRKHPLYTGKGSHLGISTKLVRDLTQGKYDSKLIVRSNFFDGLEEKTREQIPEKSEEIIKAIREEERTGNIITESHPSFGNSIKYPCLVSVRDVPQIKPDGKGIYAIPLETQLREDGPGHWMVQAANNLWIDQGYIVDHSNSGLSVSGILSLEKNVGRSK